MEVPDMSVNSENCVSPFRPVRDFIRVYAARMSIPGATTSGCSMQRTQGSDLAVGNQNSIHACIYYLQKALSAWIRPPG